MAFLKSIFEAFFNSKRVDVFSINVVKGLRCSEVKLVFRFFYWLAFMRGQKIFGTFLSEIVMTSLALL
jgi:hypothetical protein